MRAIFLSFRECFGVRSLSKKNEPSENEQRKFASRLHAAFARSNLNTSPTGRRITLSLQTVETTMNTPLLSVRDRADNVWWDNIASISSSCDCKLTQEDEMVLFYILILLKDLCLSGKSCWWLSGDKALECLLRGKQASAASVVKQYFAEDTRLDAAR
jgi:hypothetical protein